MGVGGPKRLAQIAAALLAASTTMGCAYYDDYDDGYYGGRYHGDYYGGRYSDSYRGGYYDRGYYGKGYKSYPNYRDGYRSYDHHYRGHYGGDYGGYRVCDSDGDRCYGSSEPYWNYREYYRRHGYRWDND